MSKRIAVVGGGISGLSLAWTLMKKGAEVALFEKNAQAGGCIRTGTENGYLFEYGPNSTMNSNDEIDGMCMELGLEGERVFGGGASKKRYVIRGGRPTPLPMGLLDFLSTPLWSMGGKLRLLKEPFVGRTRDERESVAAFVARRIGPELLNYALDPFVSGVYAGDPEKLELKSTFPKMAALEGEYGSLIKGAILKGLKGGNKSSRKKGIFSFRGGMEVLPAALARALGDRYRRGVSVTSLQRVDGGYLLSLSNGESAEADSVVLSAPAYVNAQILKDLSPAASKELAAIDYAPIAVVYLGFDRKEVTHPLDGFGCLVPRLEGRRLLGSLWSSSLFPGRAPEGKVSLTCFIGGARNREVVKCSDQEVTDAVFSDLSDILGVRGKPEFVRVVRHERAIPQYNIGHAERLARIGRALEPFPDLHLLGNYLKGVSVADCVMNGVSLAGHILGRDSL